MDVTFIQTADPVFYYPILAQTSRTVRQFCIQNGFRYESYVGVKRGHMPWQAAYNRVYMLKEMVDRGVTGWVYYLDADAMIGDMDFNVRAYLADKGHYAGIFSGFSSSDRGYDINSGGFAVNLSHVMGVRLALDYWKVVEAIPDAEYNQAIVWAQDIPEDQFMLYQILEKYVEHQGRGQDFLFERANEGYTNHGPFIIQRLRSKSPDFQTRRRDIAREVDGIMQGRRDDRIDDGPGFYLTASHPRLKTSAGVKKLTAIHSTAKAGMLTYGPYVPLKAGNYFAKVFGEARAARAAADIRIASDVTSDQGLATWSDRIDTIARPTKGLLLEHRFNLPRDVTAAEVRLVVDEHQDISIHAVQIHRTDPWIDKD